MEITRIRLAILSILVVLAQRSSGENEKEKEINWERCFRKPGEKGETICYAPERCRRQDFEKIMKRTEKDDELPVTPRKCDTGIQIKPLGKLKWIVYMQVKEPHLDVSKGVRLYGAAGKSIGCKKSTTGIEYIGDSKLKSAAYSKADPDFANDRLFCAFVISGASEILRDGLKAYFKFTTTDGEQIYDMETRFDELIGKVNEVIRCDPEEAKFDITYKNDDLLTHKIEIDPSWKNKCQDSSRNLYVRYPATAEYVEASEVECKKDGTDQKYKFFYTPKKDGDTSIAIPEDATFNVHCAEKACLKCGEIEAPSDIPAEEKAKIEPGNPTTGACVTATCGKDQVWKDNWVYEDANGKKKTLVTTVACKKKEGSNSATWMMQKGGGEVEVKKAWCSKKIDCATKNPLKYECPPELKPKPTQDKNEAEKQKQICAEPNMTALDFGCEVHVKIGEKALDGENKALDAKKITCDQATGIWHGGDKDNTQIPKGSYVYCPVAVAENIAKGYTELIVGLSLAFLTVLGFIVGTIIYICVRRYRKYTESEREQRKRPKKSIWRHIIPEKLIVDDLSMVKEWPDELFNKILEQWMKFSVYERKKFAERIGFEMGVSSTCDHFFKVFAKMFEVENDYRVWQGVVPIFKLLHAQATDKENNLDTDKRMRKWCISQCKPIVEKLGFDGHNNEFRDTAYMRYQIMNLLYYCDDKDFTEDLLKHFDKGQFHGLHSLNRQIAWAAAVREKDQFEVAKEAAREAFMDKHVVKQLALKQAEKEAAASGKKIKKGKDSDAASGKSSKSKKGASGKGGSKEVKGGSKESKSTASTGGSKSNNSNRSKKSSKSNKEKKGSKETPSGKAKKGGDSKESKESSKSSKRDGKDKKEKGGSKEAAKGKSREKAGADDSGKEKKEPQSDKDKKKEGKSGKDKKGSKETPSGKEKKDKSGRSGKDKKSSKEKKSSKSSKEKKDKKDKSEKDKKDKSGKEKTAQSSKESKSGKSKKSSKEKKTDKSGKSSKETKTEKTAVDKTVGSVKSMKSKKVTNSTKKKKNKKLGMKERKDADGDKLHGDRTQHIFFAIGSSRSKEQIASFLDYYIDTDYFDPSNLVYLFAATLEWDDTRSYGLDLFLNMNKKAFKSMPPGDRYHMRILKNFRRYVIGELDLQKIQDHIVNDPNYTAKHFGQIELSLMLKRIHNNVTFQPQMIEQLDEALKKLNF